MSGYRIEGAKYTPGPWRQLQTRIDDASGYQLCHLDLHGKTESERDANRRLIAAAPDLLALLQDVDEYLAEHEDVIDGDDGRSRPNRAMSLAMELRAVVLQATGVDWNYQADEEAP